MKPKIFNKLSVKLIVSISLILAGILAVHTYISVNNLEQYLTNSKFQNAYNISDLIKKSTRYGMLLNRREDVHQIIKTIGTEEGVEGIRIYNKSGQIIFSTDTTELFKTVDMTTESCSACHSGPSTVKDLSIKEKMRLYDLPGKGRALGLINPIVNEKDCYTAACHAHPQNVELLGVLDVMISLDELDEIINANIRSTIINAVFMTLVISFFSGLFITIVVNRPIQKLKKGISEVGKGNLTYKIDVSSKDELGMAAAKFNDMADKLNSAYEEIKNWNETLNQKVQEKSEELKNIYNQVMQIEKLASLGKLSATVAHELNNPLEGILTYSKLITRKLQKVQTNGENEKMIEYLTLISDESSRCGRIVKDLLLFSHRGDDEFTEEKAGLILDKSITLIQHHLDINGIQLEKNYKEPELMVHCNPQKIQQAIMSLLINAIESMSAGGKIVVRLNKEDERAVIRIADQGSGIAEKDLPHIFEPFYSTKEAAKGTGLGLSVVYGIINQHYGKVEVEQTSEHGTTFKVSLPLNYQNR